MKEHRIAFFVGTRPEAIKVVPVFLRAKELGIDSVLIVTGQHQEMLYQTLDIFNLQPDKDLKIISKGQGVNELNASLITGIGQFLSSRDISLTVVQGDTASAFCSAVASFNLSIPIAHIEAGLRSHDLSQPFPEEGYRRMIDHISSLHFAPTEKSANNLKQEGLDNFSITGNTGIDSLSRILEMKKDFTNSRLADLDQTKRTILLTTHRRENQDGGMERIFSAVNKLTSKYRDLQFVFPVHLNPKIQKLAQTFFSNNSSVILLDPLDYDDLILLLTKCWAVLTDSGGIQEEAPSFGVPIVVLREKTERQEIIENGNGVLVGSDEEKILRVISKLYEDPSYYKGFGVNGNVFGDGKASDRILKVINKFLVNNSNENKH